MQKKTAMATVLIFLTVLTTRADQAEILRRIDAMQNQINEQQAMINSLRAQLEQSQQTVSAMVKDEIKQEVEKGFAQVKTSPAIRLGAGSSGLRITGDARYRYERSERKRPGVSTSNLDRHRTRFRLGGVWSSNDGWELGAGVATGTGGATSTNATWSENNVFETGDLRLDYAYAQHKWKNIKVTLGQQKNPFKTSFLYWDGDVRPIGLTVQLDSAPLFATAGAYQVRYYGGGGNGVNADNAALFAAQTGFNLQLSDDLKWLLAVGYQNFDSATSRNHNYGTVLVPRFLDRKYRFQVGDIYTVLNTDIGNVQLGAFGHIWKNFGAAGAAGNGQVGGTLKPDDNDLGWILGMNAGIGKLKLGYAYGRVEADSVYTGIKDGDFGSSTSGMNNTDIQGHKLGVSYGFNRNFSLGATAIIVNEINGPKRDGRLFHLDALYKF